MKKIVLILLASFGFSNAIAQEQPKNVKPLASANKEAQPIVDKSKTKATDTSNAQKPMQNDKQLKVVNVKDAKDAKDINTQDTKKVLKDTTGVNQPSAKPNVKESAKQANPVSQTIVVNVAEKQEPKKEEKKPDSGWHGSIGANLLYSWNIGDFKNNILNNTLYTFVDLTDKNKLKGLGSEIYLIFEHPIPVLPNFKFQYTGLRTSKNGKASVFDSIKQDADAVIYSSNTAQTPGSFSDKGFIDYSHIDATLYYRLVPAEIPFQFDLGLSVRYFIHSMTELMPSANPKTITTTTADGKEERGYQVLPMIYADITGIIPDTGLSFTLAGNFMVMNKNNYMNDWKLGMRYAMEFVPYAHPGIEIGYRYLGIHAQTKNKAGVTYVADLHNNQIYAGIFVSF